MATDLLGYPIDPHHVAKGWSREQSGLSKDFVTFQKQSIINSTAFVVASMQFAFFQSEPDGSRSSRGDFWNERRTNRDSALVSENCRISAISDTLRSDSRK